MTNKELIKQFYQHVFINDEIDKIPDMLSKIISNTTLRSKRVAKLLLIFSEVSFN